MGWVGEGEAEREVWEGRGEGRKSEGKICAARVLSLEILLSSLAASE